MNRPLFKKMPVIVFIMMMITSCGNELTFYVDEFIPTDEISEKRKEEFEEMLFNTEFHLLISDNDVRMTTVPRKETSLKSWNTTVILEKIGNNLYRGDDESDPLELELISICGYVIGGKLYVYDKTPLGGNLGKRSPGKVYFLGIVKLKR